MEKGGGKFLILMTGIMRIVRQQNISPMVIDRLVTKRGRSTLVKMIHVAHEDWLAEQPKTMELEPYFTPLKDEDVPAERQAELAAYRKLATEHGVPANVPVCYRVRVGFTVKGRASQFGPCYDKFGYLKDWNFPDEPTVDCLVFWIPRLLKESADKTKDQQLALLAELRQTLGLPEGHMSGFGKASLVVGLVLAHFKETGERAPLDKLSVRTDTCVSGCDRLVVGRFGESGLDVNRWHGGPASDGLGVFALGVVLGF
ncbi:hypothetical protein HYV73_01835 [Candidatus Uhrbacteria bacterium]|nr:hypothetical protein [Candidatus Uhrbacteria bacterium]